jgi:multimeric flavodoxin WrbA
MPVPTRGETVAHDVQPPELRATLGRWTTVDLSVDADARNDDANWFWDRLMDSDALIVSTPIYTRTIPGTLRLLGDKISGPQADVAFTEEILRMRAAGENIPVQYPIDERVLRPRVAGFIAVGGSLPSSWKTLALPLLHTLTASMQGAVVDQVQFSGAGSPSSIVNARPAEPRESLQCGTASLRPRSASLARRSRSCRAEKSSRTFARCRRPRHAMRRCGPRSTHSQASTRPGIAPCDRNASPRRLRSAGCCC